MKMELKDKCIVCGDEIEITGQHLFGGKLSICDNCRKTRKKSKRGS